MGGGGGAVLSRGKSVRAWSWTETSSEVLRMSEASLSRVNCLNGWGCGCPVVWTLEPKGLLNAVPCLRLLHPWYTFRASLNWADVAWHFHFITISVKNQFRYFTGPQQPWPLAWSTHYITTHTKRVMLTEKNNKLSMQHCGCKPSLKYEKWNAVYGAQNGALQSKRMADKSLLIAAYQHIIINTCCCCCCLMTSQYSFDNSLEVWSSFGHTRRWSLSIVVFFSLHIVQ